MKGASPLPSFDSIASISYHLAPPSLTRLHFPNHVPCLFEDLDKGNMLHIKPYYLYELIIVFHASFLGSRLTFILTKIMLADGN